MRPVHGFFPAVAMAGVIATDLPAEPKAEPPVETWEYHVIDQSLRGFLETMAADMGKRVVSGPELRGRIADRTLSGDLETILNQVADSHKLDWFAFNGVVHVSTQDEATTRVVRLGNLPADKARAALAEMELPFDRFGLREAADGEALIVSGPPTLLALVEATIESLPDPQVMTAEQNMFRVRRGTELSLEPAIGAPVQPPVGFGRSQDVDPEPSQDAAPSQTATPEAANPTDTEPKVREP